MWKRSVSEQMKEEVRNRTDWMWSVCLSCVWLCGEGWVGGIGQPVNSEGKIDSKPDVKWNLSLGHIRCD